MARKALIVLLFALVASSCWCVSESGELLPIDQLKVQFEIFQKDLWENSVENNDIGKESAPEVQLIKQYEGFGNALQEAFPNDITFGLSVLESSWAWARAYSELRTIHALYESFRRFQAQQTTNGRVPSPRQAWIDLAQTILHDSKSSIPITADKLFAIIKNDKLFKNALKEIQVDMICDIKESPQQVLIKLYNTVALTQLKGRVMSQFSYMLLKVLDNDNLVNETATNGKNYKDQSRQTLQSAVETMKIASRQQWKCDPKKFVKDGNYIEVTELLQGYIQNEVDLNPDGTCMENCAYYSYTKSHGCYKNLYCQQQRKCNGKIINCKFLDADAWVCPAENDHRRYNYVEYENGKVLGRKQECRAKKVDSWWRWLFWHCSYCMCLCDEQGTNSDRYFNMRSVIADTKNNRVVTGLRFAKLNRIIHVQIQEGKLMPSGQIDFETVHWVPVENYKMTDKNVYNGQDYHTLTWEARAIDLDDLQAPKDNVLTGVRFKMIGAHLNFEIHVTPFDYKTGKILAAKSYWMDNTNTDAANINPRKKITVENQNIPIHTTQPSIPDSKHDQYIEFTHSSFDADVAQTTVPFLDSQPVDASFPVPLSGAGIYHKGTPNFAGFLGLKTIAYDYTPALQNALNE